MLFADWLDLAAIAAADGIPDTGVGPAIGKSTKLSTNTSVEGIESIGKGGRSRWAWLEC